MLTADARFDQCRGLLPVPRSTGAVRYDPISQARRIGFIKHVHALGFSLSEVATLLDLADGRNRRAVQSMAPRAWRRSKRSSPT
ncbi:MAG: MerR family DNA-binding protein [Burkholderiaceae bacterium]